MSKGKRRLPRFEVVAILIGGKQRFVAYDYLHRRAHFPVDPRSQPQAEGLVALLASKARERGEELSLERAESPPVKPKKPTAPKQEGVPHDGAAD